MNPVLRHHNRAMQYVDEAESLRRSNGESRRSSKRNDAIAMGYRSALDEEEKALEAARKHGAGVKTLSVLYRSAAWLAVKCKNLAKAREMIELGLSVNPPASVKVELEKLSAVVNEDRITKQGPLL